MPNFYRDLYFGCYGADVSQLQTYLEDLGYGNFTVTSFFGPKTKQALIEFQIENRITPTLGYFGPATRSLLIGQISNMNREKLYAVACEYLGTDVTPNDVIPDDVACQETVDTLFFNAFGHYLSGKEITVSTYRAYNIMCNSTSFLKVDRPLRGDILIYPTGTGNGNLSNGHVFIVGEINQTTFGLTPLMSNNSYTGIFEKNYTIDSAKARYEKIGGYFPHFFRVV